MQYYRFHNAWSQFTIHPLVSQARLGLKLYQLPAVQGMLYMCLKMRKDGLQQHHIRRHWLPVVLPSTHCRLHPPNLPHAGSTLPASVTECEEDQLYTVYTRGTYIVITLSCSDCKVLNMDAHITIRSTPD